ncbi:MAG: putative metal-binding motif-containing protein [Sandaracinus sp.]
MKLAWTGLVCALVVAGCGGTSDTPDAAAPTDANVDAAPECARSQDCDDGLVCNGAENCEAGRCVAGAPMRCDDGIACTIDVCSEAMAGCRFRVPDADADGSGDASCVDGTGTPLGDDCDDADADRFPGNAERCDASGHDEDCDPATLGGLDADDDGFVSRICCNGTSCGDDCDDGRAAVRPGATEVCNGLDDDCNGSTDEGVTVAGFADADRDGRGDPAMARTACGTAVGFSVYGDDCDDGNPAIHPGQPEICDGLDNDCDAATPADVGAAPVTWYRDADGDGFGPPGATMLSCAAPTGYVILGSDCDDTTTSRSPGVAEACNGIDDDCNGRADYVIAPGDGEDDDADGIPDAACNDLRARDCDDRDPTSGPGSLETCDGRDNDCDGRIDENAALVAFYRDADGDGFGTDSVVRAACTPPAGFSRRGGDCDDGLATRFPGALEPCNAIDDDCDGATDESAYAATSCGFTHGSGVCVSGECRLVSCDPGWGDCSPVLPWCETHTLDDRASCGACGHACIGASTCENGSCVFACTPGASCSTASLCSWGATTCSSLGYCLGAINDCRVGGATNGATAQSGVGPTPLPGTPFDLACPSGEVLIGVTASVSDASGGGALMGVRGVCGRVQTDSAGALAVVLARSIPESGNVACCSGAESPTTITCPPGEVLVGYGAEASATAPTGVTGLSLRCAPLLTSGTAQTALDLALGATEVPAGALGTATPRYDVDCPAGMVARGLYGSATTTLQSMGLSCTRLEPTLITTSPQFSSYGGASIYADCPEGQVPIAITAASATAFYDGHLDLLVLQCGLLQVAPSAGGWTTTIAPGGARFPPAGAYGIWSYYAGPSTAACPANQAVVGLGGSWGGSGAQLDVRCAPIVVTGDAATGYHVSYGSPASAGFAGPYPGVYSFGPYDCPAGTVSTGLHVWAGDIVDGVGLDCGPRTPTLAPPA